MRLVGVSLLLACWIAGVAQAQAPYAGLLGTLSGIGGIGGSFGGMGPPTVTAVTPNNGTTVGGTAVVINGTNFNGATAVNFGATSATFTVVNSFTINVASTPAHAAGTVDVTVTTPLGTSAIVVADQFTYATVVACGGALDLSTGCGTSQIGIR